MAEQTCLYTRLDTWRRNKTTGSKMCHNVSLVTCILTLSLKNYESSRVILMNTSIPLTVFFMTEKELNSLSLGSAHLAPGQLFTSCTKILFFSTLDFSSVSGAKNTFLT